VVIVFFFFWIYFLKNESPEMSQHVCDSEVPSSSLLPSDQSQIIRWLSDSPVG
jgi:hypothetical protein